MSVTDSNAVSGGSTEESPNSRVAGNNSNDSANDSRSLTRNFPRAPSLQPGTELVVRGNV